MLGPATLKALYRVLPLAALASISIMSQVPAQSPHDSTVFLSFRVVFWVRDVRRSVEFYRDSLGLPFVNYTFGRAQTAKTLQPSDPEPYAATFSIGDRELALQAADGPVGVSGERYLFEVVDAPAYAMQLKKRGVRIGVIAGDTVTAVWFSVVDPDGRRLEFRPRVLRRAP